MEIFRNEIIEAQKARTDFVKWKLFLVSGLGAAGLGFTKSSLSNVELVLCLIPLVCAYVDLMCRNLSLRIVVIGEYIRSTKNQGRTDVDLIGFEEFADQVRNMGPIGSEISAYDFEGKIYKMSSIILSLFLIIYAFFTWTWSFIPTIPLLFSGGIGIYLTNWIEKNYRIRIQCIREIREAATK